MNCAGSSHCRPHAPSQAALLDAPASADADPQPPPHLLQLEPGSLSIAAAFDGSTVLLTGATGYLGGLVLEQLLRSCPGISRVYVLIRERGETTPDGRTRPAGAPRTAEQRLDALLSSPLFDGLRLSAAQQQQQQGSRSSRTSAPAPTWAQLRAKVVPLAGQLSTPGCGLAPADAAALMACCDYVVHSAASIAFDEPPRDSLHTNYRGVAHLLALARRMPRLRGLVHLSTAYANADQPRGSIVQERVYPLPALASLGLDLGGVMADGGGGGAAHTALARELMAPGDRAERRVRRGWYCWGEVGGSLRLVVLFVT